MFIPRLTVLDWFLFLKSVRAEGGSPVAPGRQQEPPVPALGLGHHLATPLQPRRQRKPCIIASRCLTSVMGWGKTEHVPSSFTDSEPEPIIGREWGFINQRRGAPAVLEQHFINPNPGQRGRSSLPRNEGASLPVNSS